MKTVILNLSIVIAGILFTGCNNPSEVDYQQIENKHNVSNTSENPLRHKKLAKNVNGKEMAVAITPLRNIMSGEVNSDLIFKFGVEQGSGYDDININKQGKVMMVNDKGKYCIGVLDYNDPGKITWVSSGSFTSMRMAGATQIALNDFNEFVIVFQATDGINYYTTGYFDGNCAVTWKATDKVIGAGPLNYALTIGYNYQDAVMLIYKNLDDMYLMGGILRYQTDYEITWFTNKIYTLDQYGYNYDLDCATNDGDFVLIGLHRSGKYREVNFQTGYIDNQFYTDGTITFNNDRTVLTSTKNDNYLYWFPRIGLSDNGSNFLTVHGESYCHPLKGCQRTCWWQSWEYNNNTYKWERKNYFQTPILPEVSHHSTSFAY